MNLAMQTHARTHISQKIALFRYFQSLQFDFYFILISPIFSVNQCRWINSSKNNKIPKIATVKLLQMLYTENCGCWILARKNFINGKNYLEWIRFDWKFRKSNFDLKYLLHFCKISLKEEPSKWRQIQIESSWKSSRTFGRRFFCVRIISALSSFNQRSKLFRILMYFFCSLSRLVSATYGHKCEECWSEKWKSKAIRKGE